MDEFADNTPGVIALDDLMHQVLEPMDMASLRKDVIIAASATLVPVSISDKLPFR
jgi:hypothetical protein